MEENKMGLNPAGAETMVKGVAFLGILKYIKTLPGGEALLPKVIAALSPEAKQICQRKVIAVVDYPYPVFISFLRAADQVAGQGDLSMCRELGVYAAKRDIESVYNIYKKRARPADLFRDGLILWKSYYQNAGQFQTVEAAPERTVMRILDFPHMDAAHCRLMEGWISQALAETGAVWIEEPREVRCASKGDPYHEFIGSWKSPATA
jgi:hypothetical protein